MSAPNDERRFHPVSDTVVALLAASLPFLDLYFDGLSEQTGSPYSFGTATVATVTASSPARACFREHVHHMDGHRRDWF